MSPRAARMPRREPYHPDPLPEPRSARVAVPELDAIARTAGFAEVVGRLDEASARREAERCAACGLCGNCSACIDLFGCPAFFLEGGEIRIDPTLCNGCGVCAAFCPNGAIRPSRGGLAPVQRGRLKVLGA